jgi:hypothetical protein
MNSNNQQGTTTIIESPIWIGRLYTFLPTFWITWFVMFGLTGLLSSLNIPSGIGVLRITSIPILISLYIDEKFIQQFLIPSWESSKNEDHLSIRGVPYPKIREWIEWNIDFRKKALLWIAFIHCSLTIFSNNQNYTFGMLLPFIASILISTVARTWLGFKKFGFMSWTISGTASIRPQR